MATLVALVMVTLLATRTANAAWDDRSDELPGISSRNAIITAAAAAAAVTVYAVFFRGPAKHQVSLSPGKLAFGDIGVGSEAEQPLALLNRGKEPVTVESVQISGEHFALAEEAPLPKVLQPGESLIVRVTFQPTEDRGYKGRVRVRSSRAGASSAKTSSAPLRGRGRTVLAAVNQGDRP